MRTSSSCLAAFAPYLLTLFMAEMTLTPETTHNAAQTNGVSENATAKTRPFAWTDRFVNRHIGPNAAEVREMLRVCGFESLDHLIDATVPKSIRWRSR